MNKIEFINSIAEIPGFHMIISDLYFVMSDGNVNFYYITARFITNNIFYYNINFAVVAEGTAEEQAYYIGSDPKTPEEPITEDPVIEDPKDPVIEDPKDPVIEDPKDPVIEDPKDPVIEDPKDPVIENVQKPVIENVKDIYSLKRAEEPIDLDLSSAIDDTSLMVSYWVGKISRIPDVFR